MKQHKAKYNGMTYDRNGYNMHLFYTYRGHEYMITKYRHETNETLKAQHQWEQHRIDKIVEEEMKPQKPYRYEDTVDYAMKKFFEMVEN